jgi:hypothetical protein
MMYRGIREGPSTGTACQVLITYKRKEVKKGEDVLIFIYLVKRSGIK